MERMRCLVSISWHIAGPTKNRNAPPKVEQVFDLLPANGPALGPHVAVVLPAGPHPSLVLAARAPVRDGLGNAGAVCARFLKRANREEEVCWCLHAQRSAGCLPLRAEPAALRPPHALEHRQTQVRVVQRRVGGAGGGCDVCYCCYGGGNYCIMRRASWARGGFKQAVHPSIHRPMHARTDTRIDVFSLTVTGRSGGGRVVMLRWGLPLALPHRVCGRGGILPVIPHLIDLFFLKKSAKSNK